MGHQRNVKKDRKWLKAALVRYSHLPDNVEPHEADIERGRKILVKLGKARAFKLISIYAPNMLRRNKLTA